MANFITTPDGVKRPFRFSWKALRRLADELGVQKLTELGEIVQELPMDKIGVFLQIGFEAGAKREKLAVDFTFDDVEDWLDDDFSILTRAFEAFGNDFGAGLDEGNVKRAKVRK